MPLILLTGFPCSGKSTVAKQLLDLFAERGLTACVIDEPTLFLDKSQAYEDATSEKVTRGTLKAATDRQVSKNTVVILDTMNNIKGYRYELWCIARAAGTRYCLVHCDVPLEQAREWNTARIEPTFDSQVFEDLAGRYERPDGRNRWDQPLFRVTADAEGTPAVLQEVVAAMVDEVCTNQHQQVAKSLQPTVATTNPALSATNLLHEIDRSTQEVVDRIAEVQALSGAGPAGNVHFDGHTEPLALLDRPVTLPELRRHKRAFLKLVTKNDTSRLQGSAAAKRMFIGYLRTQLQ